MAHQEMNTQMATSEMVWELFAKPARNVLHALDKWMVNTAMASSRMKAAQEVAQMSDEELDDLGMSRTYAMQVALRCFT